MKVAMCILVWIVLVAIGVPVYGYFLLCTLGIAHGIC